MVNFMSCTFCHNLKRENLGTSLVVQWLRLHAPNAGGTGLIPCRGTKIPHAQGTAKEKEKKQLRIKSARRLRTKGTAQDLLTERTKRKALALKPEL